MSNCAAEVLSGLARDCASSMGGIKSVYVTAYENVSGVTLDEGKSIINTITLTSPEGAEKKFKKYNFKKNTGNMTSTYTISPENGTNYVTTVLTLSFLRMEATKRTEMNALALNELAVIVEDCNGKLWYMGYNEPVTAVSGTGETGTAKGDGNKYTIGLQDESQSLPYEVSPEALASIVAE